MSKIQKKQPSKKQTEIRLTEVPKTAVGVKAIASALSHIKNEVGVVKGIQLLSKINQKEGFDCPLLPIS